MQKKVEDYINRWNMLVPGDTVIVGLSGGADSVCLFFLLKELSPKMRFRIVAVHVNHGLRGEAADADEDYVRMICKAGSIPLECYHLDILSFAGKEKLSTEEAGRIARRYAFEEVLEKHGGTKIALAHHQDDNAETFLLHAARGSRLKGLGGIYPVNGKYIRPLLCVSRKEIEGYLTEKGIDYCIDASNKDNIYTRNRIRNHVLPYFTEYINPQTVQHLNSAMEQLRDIQGFMERETKRAETACVMWENGTALIAGRKIQEEDPLIQNMVIYQTLVKVCGQEKDLEEKHVNMIRELLKKQTGRSINLPYKMRALRTYTGIQLSKMPDREEGKLCDKTQEKLEITLPVKEQSEGSVWLGGTCISWKKISDFGQEQMIPKKTYTKWFDYDIIDKDISVRTRRAGDRIVIDGRGKTQKLKSYFINEKIPAVKRESILLIAEGQDILWITGYRQSKAYQVTARTNTILEIKINGGTCNDRDD